MKKKVLPQGSFASKVDIGRVRLTNEDRVLALYNSKGQFLLAAADGMGGANKGDYASKIAIDVLEKAFLEKPVLPLKFLDRLWFNRVLGKANKAIFSATEESAIYKGMGTTLVAILVTSSYILVANIGDSRAYSYSDNELTLLTEDQTYVSYLLRTGKISKEEALTHPDRHVLMNALGVYPSVSITFSSFSYKGQTIMVCTDGLYNSLTENDIKSILSLDLRTDQKVDMLVSLALDKSGSDNCGLGIWEALHD